MKNNKTLFLIVNIFVIIILTNCNYLQDMMQKIAFKIGYEKAENILKERYEQEMDITVAPPPPPLAHFDLSPISMKTKDQDPYNLKVSLSLGYEADDELAAELMSQKPKIEKVIKNLLANKSYEDLNSLEDTMNLSEEIKSHVNKMLTKGKIKEVYFGEFVIN